MNHNTIGQKYIDGYKKSKGTRNSMATTEQNATKPARQSSIIAAKNSREENKEEGWTTVERKSKATAKNKITTSKTDNNNSNVSMRSRTESEGTARGTTRRAARGTIRDLGRGRGRNAGYGRGLERGKTQEEGETHIDVELLHKEGE